VKLLYCGRCGDIRAPDPHGEVTSCHCGNVGARWEDLRRGILKVRAEDRSLARVIGIHNELLQVSWERGVEAWSTEAWRKLHRDVTAEAHGYLFHKDKRACWVVVIAPGESPDTSFEPWPTGVEEAPERPAG
jgi:hypothetical protein